MNWHKPIIKRGLFVLTPYEIVAFLATGFTILALCALVLIFGD